MIISKNTKFAVILFGIAAFFMCIGYALINAEINIINAFGIALILSVFALTGIAVILEDDTPEYVLDTEELSLLED